VVRVTADSLTRLLGLAGESLVQSRQLRPLVDSLGGLRARQSSLISTLDTLEEHLGAAAGPSPLVMRDLVTQLRSQAQACAQGLVDPVDDIEDYARRSEDLAGRLHHEVLKSRMRPLADSLRGFPRMVRDVARQLGKRVEFSVVGETTGVDRDILEKLEAPLNHLIRNALDHGIEPADERIAAGKRPAGTIRLEAHHRAGMLQITLADDGRGIDTARLRARVVARGLTTLAVADQLTEAELLEFLFLPGFTTREAVSEMSGRGVGLDVVQTMVRAVGGVVRIATHAGRGTRFVLQLPITRSVVRALLVRIAGEPYAFPLNRIDRIVRLAEDELQVLEGRRHFTMDDQPVGLVEAAHVLGLPPEPRAAGGAAVVVVSDRSHRFGVIVDAFLGERDLEVRPLDPRLGKVPDISSASVLEDGVPVLIVDTEDLVHSIDNLLGGRRLPSLAAAPAGDRAPGAPAVRAKRVLVVDDSITVRELQRQLLEARGYAVDVAVDGVDGWNAVRSGHYELVISDIDMPRMDGIALVRAIKGDPRLQALPVIIVSYKEREEDRIRGLDAGADAYLAKSSFHDQTLLETVADLIGEPHA
jgi:two-component system sensor histidine kinase and response regulator WspE